MSMRTFGHAAALVAFTVGAAPAATLNATFNGDFDPGFGFPQTGGDAAFAIQFDDMLGTMPGILEAVEFQSFAWINSPFGPNARQLLTVVPDIAEVDEPFFAQTGTIITTTASFWNFQNSTNASNSNVPISQFDYSVSVDAGASAVPLPAAGALMLAMLGMLGAVARRRSA